MEGLDKLNLSALILFVGAGIAVVVYILRLLMPVLRSLRRDPQERAWELLEEYYREKRELDPRYRDLNPNSGYRR